MRKPWAGVAGMEPMGSSFGAWGDCGWERCPVVGWGYWGGDRGGLGPVGPLSGVSGSVSSDATAGVTQSRGWRGSSSPILSSSLLGRISPPGCPAPELRGIPSVLQSSPKRGLSASWPSEEQLCPTGTMPACVQTHTQTQTHARGHRGHRLGLASSASP